jgi:YfiH family protein
MNPTPLTAHCLAHQRIAHGFFTRQGGVSEGIYASLNCGPGSRDVRDTVVENRRRVAASLGVDAARLVTVYQIHSPDVVAVETPWTMDDPPRADALVTARPGLALGVLAADCTPVLFADAEAGVIGAAHAGWRGALAGVTDQTVQAMEALGARRNNIAAAVGPCIAQPSYEVGPEFIDAFAAADPVNRTYFRDSDRADHYRFDLTGYVADRLSALGLAVVERLDRDTYAEPDLFFSYRRTTHLGEADYGRQISAIALR